MIDYKAWAAAIWAGYQHADAERKLWLLGRKPRWLRVKHWERLHAKYTADAALFSSLAIGWSSQVGSHVP